jgi:hypothetical protein
VSGEVAPIRRAPRAPLANHVVAVIVATDRYSVAKSKPNDRLSKSNSDVKTKAVFTETLARHSVRRYAVSLSSQSQLPMYQELTVVDQQRVVDEVLKRWTPLWAFIDSTCT